MSHLFSVLLQDARPSCSLRQVVDGGGELQSCDEATKTMRVFMAVFGGFLPAGEELVDIVDISCRACLVCASPCRAVPHKLQLATPSQCQHRAPDWRLDAVRRCPVRAERT